MMRVEGGGGSGTLGGDTWFWQGGGWAEGEGRSLELFCGFYDVVVRSPCL